MSELATLKVAELKVLCKKLGLSNYSRLGKSALVERILQAKALHQPENPSNNNNNASEDACLTGHARHHPLPDKVRTIRNEPSQVVHIAAGGSSPLQNKPTLAPTRVGAPACSSAAAESGNFVKTPSNKQIRKRKVITLTSVAKSVSNPAVAHVPTTETSLDPQVHMETHWTTRLFEHFGVRTGAAFFPGIDSTIYSNSEAFAVALRFWIHRLHRWLELGSGEEWSTDAAGTGLPGPDMSKWPMVTRIEALGSDIWLVESGVVYLVIGPTGEPLGKGEARVGGVAVRQDWADFVHTASVLAAAIKTKGDDFPQGISRILRGSREIAERVVLASCVPESFGGPKLSVAAMDSEWLGQTTSNRQSDRAELYLPQCRQVSSVYTDGLHPALAIVTRQTGNSEYVLRETGQTIGGDEIGDMWQGILGCDEKGRAAQRPEFWDAWA